MNIENSIQLRDNAKTQLEQIRDIETGFEYLNKVKAIETWAKAEKKDSELQNLIAEQKIRTQRILGKLIKEGQERGELASRKSDMGNQYMLCTKTVHSKPTTLSDLGITRNESSVFKTIANISENEFEQFIIKKKSETDGIAGELTTSSVIAFAKGKPHVSNNSGENEWYTPPIFIESARCVMGSIDLDPASSNIANKTVCATNYYTKEINGLDKTWNGNVWLNPPYSQPLITEFSNAVVKKRNEYNQSIILVNNATETSWFQKMAEISNAICFPRGRLKFIDAYGNPSGAPLQGQSVLYIGNNVSSFIKEFKKYGLCMTTTGEV